jgi:membrane protein
MRFATFRDILKGTFRDFFEDRVMRLSAALAYYSIFSLAPLLLLAAGLAGLVFGEENVNREIARQLEGFIGRARPKCSKP